MWRATTISATRGLDLERILAVTVWLVILLTLIACGESSLVQQAEEAVVEQTKEVEKTYNDLKKGLDADLEVWPESHWPGFALREESPVLGE